MDTQDLILYESASVVHGRPTKIRGERYANLFIHFSPSEKEHWDPQKINRLSDALMVELYGEENTEMIEGRQQ